MSNMEVDTPMTIEDDPELCEVQTPQTPNAPGPTGSTRASVPRYAPRAVEPTLLGDDKICVQFANLPPTAQGSPYIPISDNSKLEVRMMDPGFSCSVKSGPNMHPFVPMMVETPLSLMVISSTITSLEVDEAIAESADSGMREFDMKQKLERDKNDNDTKEYLRIKAKAAKDRMKAESLSVRFNRCRGGSIWDKRVTSTHLLRAFIMCYVDIKTISFTNAGGSGKLLEKCTEEACKMINKCDSQSVLDSAWHFAHMLKGGSKEGGLQGEVEMKSVSYEDGDHGEEVEEEEEEDPAYEYWRSEVSKWKGVSDMTGVNSWRGKWLDTEMSDGMVEEFESWSTTHQLHMLQAMEDAVLHAVFMGDKELIATLREPIKMVPFTELSLYDKDRLFLTYLNNVNDKANVFLGNAPAVCSLTGPVPYVEPKAVRPGKVQVNVVEEGESTELGWTSGLVPKTPKPLPTTQEELHNQFVLFCNRTSYYTSREINLIVRCYKSRMEAEVLPDEVAKQLIAEEEAESKSRNPRNKKKYKAKRKGGRR